MIVTIISNIFVETFEKFSIDNITEDAVTIFLIGFGVVFIALTFIYQLINLIPKVLALKDVKKKKAKSEAESLKPAVQAEKVSSKKADETNVAIAMALALYLDNQHDEESLVLTMNLRERINTSWNHKMQNIN